MDRSQIEDGEASWIIKGKTRKYSKGPRELARSQDVASAREGLSCLLLLPKGQNMFEKQETPVHVPGWLDGWKTVNE